MSQWMDKPAMTTTTMKEATNDGMEALNYLAHNVILKLQQRGSKGRDQRGGGVQRFYPLKCKYLDWKGGHTNCWLDSISSFLL